MKKFLIIAIIALVSVPMFAQQPREGGKPNGRNGWTERMRAEKVEFITRYVGLTEAEAQAFWPLYNEAEAECRAQATAEREAFKALNKAVTEQAPAGEIDKLSKAYLEAKAKAVDLGKYYAKVTKVLPPEKAAKVILSEEKFRRQQISRLGEQGGQRPGGPRGPRPENGDQPQREGGYRQGSPARQAE